MNKLRNCISGHNYPSDTARARLGKSFRKRLGVYSYKIKKIGYHRNPHAMTLAFKEEMRYVGIPAFLYIERIRRMEEN